MSVIEKNALDMAAALMGAYDLGDMINRSAEVAEYLYWKDLVYRDADVQILIQKLNGQKELFEECQRFGHFHPEYHKALEDVKRTEEMLASIESVTRFKEAEARLDGLLFDISTTVAYAVSTSIKVPSNNPLPSEGGCSTGGS